MANADYNNIGSYDSPLGSAMIDPPSSGSHSSNGVFIDCDGNVVLGEDFMPAATRAQMNELIGSYFANQKLHNKEVAAEIIRSRKQSICPSPR